MVNGTSPAPLLIGKVRRSPKLYFPHKTEVKSETVSLVGINCLQVDEVGRLKLKYEKHSNSSVDEFYEEWWFWLVILICSVVGLGMFIGVLLRCKGESSQKIGTSLSG